MYAVIRIITDSSFVSVLFIAWIPILEYIKRIKGVVTKECLSEFIAKGEVVAVTHVLSNRGLRAARPQSHIYLCPAEG